MERAMTLGIVVLVLMSCLSLSRGEMFTALVHMEGLLEMEKELLRGLNTYITAERWRLQSLEEFAQKVDRAQASVGSDPSHHLFDPVNAFQLVNRYSNGWMKLHENVYHDNAQDLMANISLHQYRFPGTDDFSGAITAIRRLQDTYRLQPSIVANGKLGSSTGLPMTAQDCYTIGRNSYEQQLWFHTRNWMLEALQKFDEGGEGSDIDLAQVYDHLAYAEYQLGNVKRATQYTRDLLQNDPSHSRAISNLRFFENLLQEHPEQYVDAEEAGGKEEESEHLRYEALCREPEPIPAKDHHKLICYYYTNRRNPRLILRPAKIEVAFPEPRIYMIRDILSEPEMARLKELAAPRLRRATARNSATGQFEYVDYRISKSGWLSAEDDPQGYVTRIDQRIEDITGLTMTTAEQLQVVNYGIGGHYEPHYDFASVVNYGIGGHYEPHYDFSGRGEDAFSSLGTGNRIATVLFYMSDVELGGATVFPILGARLPPSSGDAAFWWNLKKSGEGDYLTRHAGCPVLVGSKWVCNKWIHERGQEFRRPCGLTPEE